LSPSRIACVRSFKVSRPVFGSVTPKQARHSPLISFGSMRWRCSGVANLATGWVAYTSCRKWISVHRRGGQVLLACIDCAPAMPAPLLSSVQILCLCFISDTTYSEIVCNIIVASDIPRPDPPSSSGRAIPIQPSFESALCNSWGYSPDSSCAAQYS